MASYMKVGMDDHITPHFTVGEFCNHPDDLAWLNANIATFWPRLQKLCAVLERLRAWAGCPVQVTSGVREPRRNMAVGGVPDSQHCKARAGDTVVATKTPAQVAAWARKQPEVGGVGQYDGQGFTHIDVRDRSGAPVPVFWKG